ncbi:MAG: hypothetical protein WKF30_19390, partial [Pyrinomonadaceae bacterium]
LDLIYLFVFGIGSIGGMLFMSALVSIPFIFAANRFAQAATPVRVLAGFGSVAFGLFYAWEQIGGILL